MSIYAYQNVVPARASTGSGRRSHSLMVAILLVVSFVYIREMVKIEGLP